jgi:hypothetical protein
MENTMSPHASDPVVLSNLAGEAARSTARNLAERIARGDIRFPGSLSAKERLELSLAVQQIRRDRLFRFIARAIAQDIAVGASHEGDSHAP